MDRLKREANPPTGQLASPIPQYKKPGSTDYEAVEGQHGAPFAILKDASGNVVSPATDAKLEQVRSELELVKSELQTIKANQLSGDQKVQLSGKKTAERETLLSAVSIPAGETTGWVQVDPMGCKKVLLLFNSNKPWSAYVGELGSNVAPTYVNMYPRLAEQQPTISTTYPVFATLGISLGNSDVQNLVDALDKAVLFHNMQVRMHNLSDEVATMTLRVIRIWEV